MAVAATDQSDIVGLQCDEHRSAPALDAAESELFVAARRDGPGDGPVSFRRLSAAQ